MLWNKEKHIVSIRGGAGHVTTNPLHGLIQQLIVMPDSDSTIWSLKIIDKEGDTILDIRDHKGRLDDRQGLPVGRDSSQKVSIFFSDVTKNEKIVIILKVREL